MLNDEDLLHLIHILRDRPDSHVFIDEEMIEYLSDISMWCLTNETLTEVAHALLKQKGL